MSPSIAVQLRTEQPALPAHGFAFGASANSNSVRKTSKPRKRAVKSPKPPNGVWNLSQRVQAADEHWQELVAAHNARTVEHTKESDLALFVMFSCFLHAMIDDRNLCEQLLIYFDRKLEGEIKHRIEPVKP